MRLSKPKIYSSRPVGNANCRFQINLIPFQNGFKSQFTIKCGSRDIKKWFKANLWFELCLLSAKNVNFAAPYLNHRTLFRAKLTNFWFQLIISASMNRVLFIQTNYCENFSWLLFNNALAVSHPTKTKQRSTWSEFVRILLRIKWMIPVSSGAMTVINWWERSWH